jgi:VWFA-related protein
VSRAAALVLTFSLVTALPLVGQSEHPQVSIVTPTASDVLSGLVTLAAEITSPAGLRMVTFYADGVRACGVSAAPYRCTWDSASMRGARDIRVVAEWADGTRLVQTVRTKGTVAAFRASVDSVLVAARVQDGRKRYVRGLVADNFRLFEDEVPQPIVTFTTEASGGDVVLALDSSGSMTSALPELRAATRAFLGALPRTDAVTVAAFNTAIEVLAPRGVDPVARVASLDRLRAGGQTALYDVLIQAVDLFPASVARRAIVMFTDGDDVASRASVAMARMTLQTANVMLYVIAQGKAAVDKPLQAQLSALATETGGAAFFAPHMSDTRAHFAEIAEELSNQYVLGYVPTHPFGDGSWRKIRVEAVDAQRRLVVTARQGYFASRRPDR